MYVGLTIIFGLLWYEMPTRVLAESAAICAGVCAIGAIAATPGMLRKYRDARYDLSELRKVQDREELNQIELNETTEFESVHCLNCGEMYNSHLPVCPRCRASQGFR